MRYSILYTTAFAALALGLPVEDTVTASAISHISGHPVAIIDGTITINGQAYHEEDDSSSGNSTSAPSATSHEDATGTIEKREPLATLYRDAAMRRHNFHRANHGSPPVTWSADLAQAAMKSAKRCTFAHFMGENGLQYGQNLALGLPAGSIAAIISDQWYSEVEYFKGNYGKAQPDYGKDMSNFSKWGHFTQVVWKDSTKIGCATWRCKQVATSATNKTPMPAAYGGDVTYCNYQAPGNYGGQYAKNIGKPKANQNNVSDTQGVNPKAIAKSYGDFTGQKW